MDFAAGIAKSLHDRLRKRGVKDGHGLKNATAEMEAGGAQSELATSLLLNCEWSASQDGHDSKGPDVGTRTQVRSSNKPRNHHSLIVRSKDIEKYGNVPFVLVIQTGKRFEVKGWMMAFDALTAGKLWDGGDRSRPDAWFVPEEKLLPIETLVNP
jgi:hypothetical protein